jgi:hypothetical protein
VEKRRRAAAASLPTACFGGGGIRKDRLTAIAALLGGRNDQLVIQGLVRFRCFSPFRRRAGGDGGGVGMNKEATVGKQKLGCNYCEGEAEPGWIETDNNGPIVPCPICNPEAASADYLAEKDAEVAVQLSFIELLRDEIARLLADNERLREALKPFARFAEKAEGFVEDRAKDGGSPIMPVTDFRLADFRRARAALVETEKP